MKQFGIIAITTAAGSLWLIASIVEWARAVAGI